MHSPSDHTFVICAYKENPFLEDTIASIEAQTQLGSILAITSTPNDYIAGICANHNIDLRINTEESSIALDWNFGYNQANTPLVTIAHQDDVYEPLFLERTLDSFNRASNPVGIVHTDYYELREGKRIDNNPLLKTKRLLNAAFARGMAGTSRSAKRRGLAFGDSICCPSVTFDASIVGPSVFDTKYANSCDYRTWVNLANRNVAFGYVSEILMGHRIYAESTTTKNIANNVRSKEDREIMASLWPRPIAHAIFAAYKQGQKSNELHATH